MAQVATLKETAPKAAGKSKKAEVSIEAKTVTELNQLLAEKRLELMSDKLKDTSTIRKIKREIARKLSNNKN